jgi:ABC-type branched-subunit amino acid transport system ATPase component
MNLRSEKASKKFGRLWALEQVSLDLEKEQVVGFVLV